MKKLFIIASNTALLIAFVITMFSISSCSKEDNDDLIIWDINPLTIDIILRNADGENLFCPSTDGNYIGKNISVEYNNKTYDAQWDLCSRALPGFFIGLFLKPGKGEFVPGVGRDDDPTRNSLAFGEFDGGDNQDISFVLKIEDHPQVYRFDITHRIKWENRSPVITTIKKLNDEIVNTDVINITL